MVFGPGDTFFRGGLISKLKRLELLGSGFSGTTHVDTSFEAKVALLKQSFPCWTVQDDAVSKQLSDRNVIFDRFTIFLVVLVERNLHDSGMSHATTASPKPFFRAPWRVDHAVIGKGNTGRIMPVDIPAHARAAHKGLLQTSQILKMMNRPSCPPDDPIGQETEMN